MRIVIVDGVAATRAADTLAAAAGIAERAAAERVRIRRIVRVHVRGNDHFARVQQGVPGVLDERRSFCVAGDKAGDPAIAAWKLVAIVFASVETVLASVDVACALVTVVLAVVAAVVKPSAAVRAANGLPPAPPRLPSADFPMFSAPVRTWFTPILISCSVRSLMHVLERRVPGFRAREQRVDLAIEGRIDRLHRRVPGLFRLLRRLGSSLLDFQRIRPCASAMLVVDRLELLRR